MSGLVGRVKVLPGWVLRVVTSRDSDLYWVTSLAGVLAVVDLLAKNFLDALLAGTLASLALSQVRLRRSLDALAPSDSGIRFLSETPAELPEFFDLSTSVTMVGVSLDRTVRNLYAQLERFLRRGGELRVILVDPEETDAVAIADRRAYNEHGADYRKGQIQFTLKTLAELSSKTGSAIAVGLVRDPLSFGACWFVDPMAREQSRLVVQHYSYKKANVMEPNPVFVLTSADAEWFSGYGEEIENLWKDARKIVP